MSNPTRRSFLRSAATAGAALALPAVATARAAAPEPIAPAVVAVEAEDDAGDPYPELTMKHLRRCLAALQVARLHGITLQPYVRGETKRDCGSLSPWDVFHAECMIKFQIWILGMLGVEPVAGETFPAVERARTWETEIPYGPLKTKGRGTIIWGNIPGQEQLLVALQVATHAALCASSCDDNRIDSALHGMWFSLNSVESLIGGCTSGYPRLRLT
jgi:hypothetical protein